MWVIVRKYTSALLIVTILYICHIGVAARVHKFAALYFPWFDCCSHLRNSSSHVKQ